MLFALAAPPETLAALEIVGGVLIFAGIAWERYWRRPLADAVAGGGDAPEADVREAVRQ